MNNVYKSVWNESIGAWIAVSQTAKGRGKKSNKKIVTSVLLASASAAGGLAFAPAVFASQVCTTGANGASPSSIQGGGIAIFPGCGSNAYLPSGHDIAELESGSSLVYVDGTSGTVNFRATSTGNLIEINSAGQIRNIGAGTSNTDAVNVGQLTPLVSALGGAATLNADGSVTGPVYTLKGTTYNTVGDALKALADTPAPTSSAYFHANSTLADSTATGSESIAIGGAAAANNMGDISIGSNSSATSNTDPKGSSIAIGSYASSNAVQSVALGAAATASANGDVAIGNLAQATGTGLGGSATAVGFISTANGKLATAIGYRANATGVNSVAVGANSVADADNTVSVGSSTAQRRIVNVAAGTQANDAVNVTQLQNVTTLLGGGAKVNADGTIQAPAYTVAGTSLGTVGDAITKIDTELTSKVAYDTTDKAHITLGGVGTSKLVTISNLQIGDLSSTSTDAVNGSQLYSTNQRVGSLETFEGNVNNGGGVKYFHTSSTLADSSATGANSVAVGGAALSSGKNSVALGSNSVADRDNTVSVGAAGSERQVTNVAAGTASTDAVNVGQLNAVSNSVSSLGASAIKYDTNADGTPDYANATLGNGNTTGTALHNVAAATGNMDAVNLGQLNDMMGQVTNLANGAYNPLFSADGNRDTEVATSSGTHSVASGANAVASGVNAVASGATSVASGASAIAVGSNTSATAKNAVAVGANASATANNSVALGAGSVADRANAVSVGTTAAGGQRQVTNVAAGTDGTDAVNVNQMQQSATQGLSLRMATRTPCALT